MKVDDIFITNHYRVLKLLYDRLVTFDDETFSVISQQEIADKLNLNKSTVSNIFKVLIDKGYILKTKYNGKYRLSDEAIKTIKVIR